jgi:hypothetical protein
MVPGCYTVNKLVKGRVTPEIGAKIRPDNRKYGNQYRDTSFRTDVSHSNKIP